MNTMGTRIEARRRERLRAEHVRAGDECKDYTAADR